MFKKGYADKAAREDMFKRRYANKMARENIRPGVYHCRTDAGWWTLLVSPDGRAFVNSEGELTGNFDVNEPEAANEVLNAADDTGNYQEVNINQLKQLAQQVGVSIPSDLLEI